MQTYIQKWGNSLALRIPVIFAENLKIAEGSLVEVSSDNNKIIIVPLPKPRYNLEELLNGISEDNIHKEVDTGIPQGNEIW